MVKLIFKVAPAISAGTAVEEFNAVVAEELDAQTTPLEGGTFTVTVSADNVQSVKKVAKANNFWFVGADVV